MKYSSILLALLSGILLWLGWPTYGVPLLLLGAFVPLLFAERRIRKSDLKLKGWRILGLSYLSFFIWNIATTWWLYLATGFGMWFAVLVNSLLMALVFLCYHKFASKVSQGAAFTFLVCSWISFEYLHLHWDFSWPWLNLGNGFSEYTGWIQWYEYTGTFGGTLWIWSLNVVLFYGVSSLIKKGFTIKTILKKSVTLALMVFIPIGISQIIFLNYFEVDKNPGTEIVIVQPNIDPYEEKYSMGNEQIARLISNLTVPKLTQTTEFVIAPETVFADNIRISQVNYHPTLQGLRGSYASYPNLNYLGGISLVDVFKNPDQATRQTNLASDGVTYYNDYNSAMFFNQKGAIDLYHKSKLVVGIENFPYKNILKPILGDAMIDLGGTVATKTTQEDRSVFKSSNDIKVAPIICYESVYGEYVTDYIGNGAEFFAIITNDAWWGNTQGHQQHLSLAKLRAIESRRWIARSANTGISAIIDHYGNITQSLEYDKQGVIKGTIRKRNDVTFYVKHGDYIARIAIFMALFTFLFGHTRRRKKRS
ncbi:apolipoprotein N-acyltransferase [Nonlabens arenilitoris]|uniref:Apolipoprotein N-acyltransferase n=1 Tax=Nonlabens arenilitoris TaxID=1217969 RepID=A0A2S7UCT0_9FLAO|nr:apolipoprotein N-acyltransferase [Nonlabens arenilitoris]PQJ32204.1 apolipoprotein N-acyltransferase [Nonlabens arenilitoris]